MSFEKRLQLNFGHIFGYLQHSFRPKFQPEPQKGAVLRPQADFHDSGRGIRGFCFAAGALFVNLKILTCPQLGGFCLRVSFSL